MPQAKPTQVIVHRFELQTSERKYLEEIIEKQNQASIIRSVSNAAGPITTALAVGVVGWAGIKAWATVQAALLGPIERAEQTINELFEPRDNKSMREKVQSGELNLSENGNIFSETILNPTVRDWVVFDLGDLLSLAPEGSKAKQAGDFLENTRDSVQEGILGIFGL